jgi:DNA invertase Pin-like site-specific DNA recombinase
MKTKNLRTRTSGNAPKRAGILIRVSSAEQGKSDKASPEIQERDCREHCQKRGYAVLAVYKDIDKYRDAHGRLVEPSGTRSDRPGLKQALADIDAGKIDILVGWRQDRLIRGITRALIELKERVTEGMVEIELAKEQFNLSTFEVLAWAAGVELQAKHDRLMLGVARRLENGKAWQTQNPLGYNIVNGVFEVVPDEAKWINQIWKWYADGVPTMEIRRRLIAGGAPQRTNHRKYAWQMAYIHRILSREYYYSGVFEWNWNGKVYKIAIPVIVGAETARRVGERRKRYKAYPAGRMKNQGLVSGLAYCEACNSKMVTTNTVTTAMVAGKPKVYRYAMYGCHKPHEGILNQGCARSVAVTRLDADVWTKVWSLFSKPGRFEKAIDKRIAQLEAHQTDAEAECQRLEHQIEDTLGKRHSVINWALEGKINDADMALQLKGLDAAREDLERELGEKRLLADHKVDRLKELAAMYREEVKAGAKHINQEPETPEEEKLFFDWKRKIVERLVMRVDVLTDKSTEVHTEIDLTNLRIRNIATRC